MHGLAIARPDVVRQAGQQGQETQTGRTVAAQRHFLISYSGADTAWAEWLAQTLEDAGYQTVVQAWDFHPGQDFLHQMHQATIRGATRTRQAGGPTTSRRGRRPRGCCPTHWPPPTTLARWAPNRPRPPGCSTRLAATCGAGPSIPWPRRSSNGPSRSVRPSSAPTTSTPPPAWLTPIFAPRSPALASAAWTSV